MKSKATKRPISLRVSPEILGWFQRESRRGYQSRINQVLESYVREQQRLAERRAGRAQELFHRFYARCFWHIDHSLQITPENIQIVVEGLRKYGGREGFILAEELCQ